MVVLTARTLHGYAESGGVAARPRHRATPGEFTVVVLTVTSTVPRRRRGAPAWNVQRVTAWTLHGPPLGSRRASWTRWRLAGL